ncbi:malto-oligosyltrehalose synthase, partial [mine drainage metagenome]
TARPLLDRIYHDQVPSADPPEVVVETSKREVVEEYFPADIDRWVRAARRDPPTGSPPPPDGRLHAELPELAVDFDVYRSYVEPTGPIDPVDRAIWRRAFDRATHRGKDTETLRRWWTAWDEGASESRGPLLRFQQLTGPVMAKGVEDRALYRDLRLAALNEVGIPPGWGSDDAVAAFHRDATARARHWPMSMVTTSTHDTKRSEDVRARLLALAQEPTVWTQLARLWQEAIRRVPGVPGPPERSEAAFYLLFQTVVGTWPLDGIRSDRYRARLRAYG